MRRESEDTASCLWWSGVERERINVRQGGKAAEEAAGVEGRRVERERRSDRSCG
jgi:hypothetical protein